MKLVLLGQRESPAPQVLWAALALWVPGECQEREAGWVLEDCRAHVDHLAMLENQVQWVLWGSVAPQGSQETRV